MIKAQPFFFEMLSNRSILDDNYFCAKPCAKNQRATNKHVSLIE